MHMQDESAFDTNSGFSASGSVGLPGMIFGGVVGLVMLIAMWKVFSKAGQPGWYCFIPILNTITLLKIAGKPWFWFFGLFVPFLNLYVIFVMSIEIAKAFGKSSGFGVGLVFLGPIFYSILAFSDARYQGPSAAPGAYVPHRA